MMNTKILKVMIMFCVFALFVEMTGCKSKIVYTEKQVEKLSYVCPKCEKTYDTAQAAAACCGVQTVEKEVYVYKYVCPKCKKEFTTAQEAADCCGVQIEYVDKQVDKIVKKYICPIDGEEYDTLEEAEKCCGGSKYFTFTFDSDEGTAVENQFVLEGKKAVEPKDPSKTGYKFLGWYNGDVIYDFTEEVTSDVSLKAKWEILVFTVTLLDSDSETVLKTIQVAYNEKIEIPSDIIKENYILGDWYYSGNKFNFNNSVTSDISLIASWVGKYEVGNIILSDGTVLPYTISTLNSTQKAKAMAIIYTKKTSTSDALAMGINFSDTTYAWTTISEFNPGSGIAGTIGTGDKDGSDNYAYVGGGSKCPAFQYCAKYGINNNYESYSSGWYLPTAAELYSLYLAKDKVNEALAKIGKSSIPEKTYWTSNNNYRVVSSFDSYWQQNRTNYYYEADTINFSDGTEANVSNTYSRSVLAIMKFN